MSILKTKGLVIKETKVGECDKIITIFSNKKGKIQAAAKGARRPKSVLIAGTEFLCYSNLVLFKGSNMYSVSQSEIIEDFFNIRCSIEKLSYSTYFCELASEVIEEGNPSNTLLRLLLNTLYMLSNTKKDPKILKVVYELRLMSIIGYTPNLIGCTNCGTNEKTMYFNSAVGGLICENCIEKYKDRNNIVISRSTLDAMRYIIYSDLSKIFSFNISENVKEKLDYVSKDFLMHHIEKEFKTLKYLEHILEHSKYVNN